MGKQRKPKWASTAGGSSKMNLDGVAMSIIKYMELARAAQKYFRATKRLNPKIDYRLSVETEFCEGLLIHFFKVTKSFIANVQHTILKNKEEFDEEVKGFCDGILPEKPLITTDNLEGEMAQIIKRDKAVGGQGKGRVII